MVSNEEKLNNIMDAISMNKSDWYNHIKTSESSHKAAEKPIARKASEALLRKKCRKGR